MIPVFKTLESILSLRHLEKEVANIKDSYLNYLLADNDYKKYFAAYQSIDQKEKIYFNTLLNLKFANLQEQSKPVITRKITAKQVIDELKNDEKLNAWVKEGKTLHQGKSTCSFCGSKLPIDLFSPNYS